MQWYRLNQSKPTVYAVAFQPGLLLILRKKSVYNYLQYYNTTILNPYWLT